MIFGIFLAIIFIGLIAGSIFFGCKKGKLWILITGSIVGFVLFLTIPFSFHQVNTGESAVVKHFGEAKEIKGPGLHFDFWMVNSYEYFDSKVQNMSITTMAYSSDAQTMNLEMTVQYQIMSDKVLDITKQYGSLSALNSRIESIVIEKTKAVLSAHKAMDIIANRADMSPAVEDIIQKAIGDEYFVNVNTVVLTNIDFSDAFEKAVEDKMIAEQQQLKAEYENQKKIAQAQAEAEAKIIQAEADNKVKIMDAEAASKANELQNSTLTPQILQKRWLEKWNGVLPSYVAGDSSNIMFGITN